jgi:hypothetical protein
MKILFLNFGKFRQILETMKLKGGKKKEKRTTHTHTGPHSAFFWLTIYSQKVELEIKCVKIKFF